MFTRKNFLAGVAAIVAGGASLAFAMTGGNAKNAAQGKVCADCANAPCSADNCPCTCEKCDCTGCCENCGKCGAGEVSAATSAVAGQSCATSGSCCSK